MYVKSICRPYIQCFNRVFSMLHFIITLTTKHLWIRQMACYSRPFKSLILMFTIADGNVSCSISFQTIRCLSNLSKLSERTPTELYSFFSFDNGSYHVSMPISLAARTRYQQFVVSAGFGY